MIQQYDEEQILLERRVEELKSQIQYEEVKQAETGRFIALVKKYKDCTEPVSYTHLIIRISLIADRPRMGSFSVYSAVCHSPAPRKWETI